MRLSALIMMLLHKLPLKSLFLEERASRAIWETSSLFKELVNGREGCQWGQNNLRPKRSFITTTFIRHHLSNRSGVVIDWSWVLMFTRKNIIIVRWLIKKIYNRMLVEVNGYWVFSTTYLMVFFQTHVRTLMMMNYELMTVVVLVLSKR